MSKVITMPAWIRPQYLGPVLESLSRCHGIEDYHLIICREPGNDRVGELCESADFCTTTVVHNDQKLGIRKNTYQCLLRGFKEAEYVIHVEEDVKLAPDALAYFEWARDEYRDDPTVFTVSGFVGPRTSRECMKPKYEDHEWYQVRRRAHFTPSGWATWLDRWEEMKDNWQIEPSGPGWGPHLNKVLRKGRDEVFPVVARTQNVGIIGLHMNNPQLFEERFWNPYWAGAFDVPPGEYYEV